MYLLPRDTPKLGQLQPLCMFSSSSMPSSLTGQDVHEIPGSRGEANFVWKCRLCTKTHTASITSGPKAYEAQEKQGSQKILEMDCRGLEFIEFKPDGEWEAKGVDSTTTFTGIDLIEGEWYDYDEKKGEEVSIKEITWTVGR
ncbi:unnamed protein product [Penicillium salamii]|nr:unnamed protein product [Penicillium salamii]